jgi:hypothetical protein
MGQKQLLLIVLGMIVVAIAFTIGLALFDTQVENSNRDAVILDLNRISGFANQYFTKSTAQMGGDRSFVGFEIPPSMKTTVNGTYTLISAQQGTLLLQGIGNVEVGDQYVTYQLLVRPNDVTVNKIY